jgi:hypothetical protein
MLRVYVADMSDSERVARKQPCTQCGRAVVTYQIVLGVVPTPAHPITATFAEHADDGTYADTYCHPDQPTN